MPPKDGLSRYLFKKGETFYVRVAVPKALRGSFGGKDIILRSLKTGDRRIAEDRKDIAVGEIKAEFERLLNLSPFDVVANAVNAIWQNSPSGAGAVMTEAVGEASVLGSLSVEAMTTDAPERKAEIEAQKQALLQRELAKMPNQRDDLFARRGRFLPKSINGTSPEAVREWIRQANTVLEFWESGKDPATLPALHDFASLLSGGDASPIVKAQIIQEIPSALLPERARPYVSQARNNAVPDDGNITLGELVRRFFADDRRATLDEATRRNYAITIEILFEVLGENTPVRAVRRDDVRRVQQVIRHLPPRAKNQERFFGMSFVEIAEASKAARESGDDLPAFKAGTRNKYIRNIGTLFEYALREGQIDANPALGLTVHLPEDRDEEDKQPFTDSDLRALFPCGYRAEGLNWLPLVMLYQGFRPTEAAQLDTVDVLRIDGVWVFDISDETKGMMGRASREDKSLKNDRSTPRRVPIHQKLLDLGFLDYLDQRQSEGAKKLFAVRRYGEAGYFQSIRHEFSKWLEAVGAKRANTSPHSFRHNWATASFRTVDDNLRKIMGGWTLGKGVDVQTYLHTHRLSLADMKTEIDKISFDILTAVAEPANAHLGLIAFQRTRRGGDANKVPPVKKKRLVPGKERK